MTSRFLGTREEVDQLVRIISEIPEIQRTLTENHPALQRADRAAHQQQIGAGRAVLEVANELPSELNGIGLFFPGMMTVGIGRLSTGLGCPHLETDPDFLGLMLAFQTSAKERVDFLGINDPSSPTDTVEQFIALLVATAAAAGAEVPFGRTGQLDIINLTAAQARLFNTLRKRLGIRQASSIFLHLVNQTTRTARSSSAIQSYWTGVVEVGEVAGKFALVPIVDVNRHRDLRPGPRYLSEDWERHLRSSDIVFRLLWIPFRSEADTPMEKLTAAWAETHAVNLGTVTFPQTDPASRDARLLSILASEMGANPGNWVSNRRGEPRRAFAGTDFTAARQLAYALSQDTRAALPQSAYQEFFDTGGAIGPELEKELLSRFDEKVKMGHATPSSIVLDA
jgi:hypothetical protein